MWTYIVDLASDHAGLIAVLGLVAVAAVARRVYAIDTRCAERKGVYDGMHEQIENVVHRIDRMDDRVIWLIKKAGGNGDLLKK